MKKLAAVLGVTAFLLCGCYGPKEVTCEDYGKKDLSDRSTQVEYLVKAHDLDPKSNFQATIALKQKIDSFCGINLGLQEPATRNLKTPIDKAVNWKEFGDDSAK